MSGIQLEVRDQSFFQTLFFGLPFGGHCIYLAVTGRDGFNKRFEVGAPEDTFSSRQ